MRILNTTLSFATFVWASGSAVSGTVGSYALLAVGGAIGLVVGTVATVAAHTRQGGQL